VSNRLQSQGKTRLQYKAKNGGNEVLFLLLLLAVLSPVAPAHPAATKTTPPESSELISQNVFINQLQKVNCPTQSSTYCLLLLIKYEVDGLWGS